MNYTKKAAEVKAKLRKEGAEGTLIRTASNMDVTRATCYGMRIERRIGDVKKIDESVEIGDLKYMVDGDLLFEENDLFEFPTGGAQRVVMRVEDFTPTNIRIFSYIWTRSL